MTRELDWPGIPPLEPGDLLAAADIDAAELLADRAHHTLSAGPTGAEIRHLLTISQGIDLGDNCGTCGYAPERCGCQPDLFGGAAS